VSIDIQYGHQVSKWRLFHKLTLFFSITVGKDIAFNCRAECRMIQCNYIVKLLFSIRFIHTNYVAKLYFNYRAVTSNKGFTDYITAVKLVQV